MLHREVCLRSIPLKYPPMGSARSKECLYNCMNWGLPQTSCRFVPPLCLYLALYLYLYYLKFTRDPTSLPTSSIASRCFGSCAIKSSLIFITWETGLSTLDFCKKVHIVVNVTFLQKTFSVWWINLNRHWDSMSSGDLKLFNGTYMTFKKKQLNAPKGCGKEDQSLSNSNNNM